MTRSVSPSRRDRGDASRKAGTGAALQKSTSVRVSCAIASRIQMVQTGAFIDSKHVRVVAYLPPNHFLFASSCSLFGVLRLIVEQTNVSVTRHSQFFLQRSQRGLLPSRRSTPNRTGTCPFSLSSQADKEQLAVDSQPQQLGSAFAATCPQDQFEFQFEF